MGSRRRPAEPPTGDAAVPRPTRLQLAKRLAQGAFHLFGYQISRTSNRPEVERVVLNAHYRGHRFRCFAGDPLCELILRGEGWDNQLDEILPTVAPGPGGHVLEVGANVGASLIPRASEHPHLTFHCLEPVPAFFELLRDNASSYGVTNVQLYPQAVGAVDGDTLTLHTQLGTAGALAQYDGHQAVGSLEVPTATLDGLFGHLDVRLLKIDTDGFELPVLRGARGILHEQRPPVFLELHTRLTRRAGIDPAELTDVLRSAGYTHMRVWDNFGGFLLDTSSFAELHAAAERAEHYVDVLFRAPARGGA